MNEKKYNVLIVEDMPQSQRLLMNFVKARPELSLVGTAKDGKEALDKIESNAVDLLLLDIQLPLMDGIEVLNELNRRKIEHIYVIFTTAFDEYAVKAFEIEAIDYLLKPISQERFNEAIDKFLKSVIVTSRFSFLLDNNCLSFKEKRKTCVVPYEDIIYLSSSAKNTVIHTEDRDFEACALLKKIEEKLPDDIFMRVHKQYIVNIKFIINLEYSSGSQYCITLKDQDDTILPVGKNNVPALKERLAI